MNAQKPKASPLPPVGKLLSVQHAAAYLDMPPSRLRDNYRKWGLPAYRVGRELRFFEADLLAWVKAHPAD